MESGFSVECVRLGGMSYVQVTKDLEHLYATIVLQPFFVIIVYYFLFITLILISAVVVKFITKSHISVVDIVH